MKKLLLFLVLAILATPAFASVGIINNGVPAGTASDLLLNCPTGSQLVYGSAAYANCGNLLGAGTANGGFTSLATIDTGIPLTYDFLEKSIQSTAGGTSADTLYNGVPGQIVTIEIGTVVSGSWKVTPATSSGWVSMTFNTQGQIASFLYVNSTVGWVVLNYTGSTLPTLVVK